MQIFSLTLVFLFSAMMMFTTSNAEICNWLCPPGTIPFCSGGLGQCIPKSTRSKRGKDQWDQIPCQSDKDCPGSRCIGGFCFTGGK